MARGGGRRAVQWIALGLAALLLAVSAVGIVGGVFAASDDDSGAPNTVGGPDTTFDDTLVATSTPTSATTTAPDDQTESDIAVCDQRARDAVVTYQPSKEMVVGEAERVEAVATFAGVSPPTSLEGDEPAVQEDATLACRVEAELSGLSFEIDPRGPQKASFPDEGQVTWQWIVKPTESGSPLPLQLTIRGFPDGFQDFARGPNPITVEIAVSAEERSVTERVADVWWGFFDSRLWTGIAGILALLAFLGVRGREPRRDEEPPAPPAPSVSSASFPRPQGRPPPPPPRP